ncbi:hypothetical protein [Tichowtungia aerotolerans]|uniref:Uncharacterized protein n=1 Tax=Tichowtungia aerotolerans TaxID=2697043 RepID=A0A6P1MFD3_9BACT|nr:hypothetical protein [Tichowtungia aerotolerans]QHI70326.1 hypothetical protein GT409_13035 [Tichowtungia aerotolerans]
MKNKLQICLLLMVTALVVNLQADYVTGTSGGYLTDSNNWSKGVFDNTENPAAGTSTGASSDLLAGDRTMIMVSDFATFDEFSLGSDNNTSGGHIDMTGGTLSATNLTINVNNTSIANACSITQSGGSVIVANALNIGKMGAATYTISGGSLTVGGNVAFNSALDGNEHTLVIDGQGASSITVGGGFFAGGGSASGCQNLKFNLGETGITPVAVSGAFYADEQTEIILDGADYTGGVQTITLATYANNEDGAGVVETFLNFNDYIPSLVFTNGALLVNLVENPIPELLLDGSFEGLSVEDKEPNSATSPWFTNGEGANASIIPTTDSASVNAGLQAVYFNYYFDSGAIVQNVDKTLESYETYEFSVWNLLAEPSSNSSHTNESSFNLSVWTSDTLGGTYIYRKGLFGNLAATTNEYQQFTFSFSTADIVTEGASVGDYIQVRIAKANENSTYRLFFDDASLKMVGIVLPDPGYPTWADSYGVGGELWDADADGWNNLTEYALGGNPTNGFIDGNIPVFESVDGAMLYVYAQRTDDTNLTYYLETDSDLVVAPGWTNAGYTVVATNVTGGTFDFVTNSVPIIDPVKFIRLVIEK